MEIIRKSRKTPESIPDPAYRQEAQQRALRAQGWDYDRAIRHVRARRVEDKDGRKSVDLTQ